MPTDVKTGQPIYTGAPSVGLRNVGSYQVSGEPWITGTIDQAVNKVKKYTFPFVTREVSVFIPQATTNTHLWIHFISGSGHDFSDKHGPITRDGGSDVYQGLHYVPLVSGSTSVTFRAKCKEIYVAVPNATGGSAVTYSVLADITNVPTRRMYHLTGSGHSEVV